MNCTFTGPRGSISQREKAVIDEVERREDHVKTKYNKALKDEKLPRPRASRSSRLTPRRVGTTTAADFRHQDLTDQSLFEV